MFISKKEFRILQQRADYQADILTSIREDYRNLRKIITGGEYGWVDESGLQHTTYKLAENVQLQRADIEMLLDHLGLQFTDKAAIRILEKQYQQ